MMRSAPLARPMVLTAPDVIRKVSGSISVPEDRKIHIGRYLSAPASANSSSPSLVWSYMSKRPRMRKRVFVIAGVGVLVITAIAGYVTTIGAGADIDSAQMATLEPGTLI